VQLYRYFVSASQRVFIVFVYFVMTQSGDLWIHTKFHIPSSSGLLAIAFTPKANVAGMLFFVIYYYYYYYYSSFAPRGAEGFDSASPSEAPVSVSWIH
jgi:hypothetical protein